MHFIKINFSSDLEVKNKNDEKLFCCWKAVNLGVV